MIECTKDNIGEINYFLRLMNQKEISEESFLNTFIHFVMIKNVGFLSYSIYYDRAEINYLFILDEYRRKGYASKMLNYVIDKVKKLENITLEVNINNEVAINLYRKFNFEVVAIREKYYGSESAYLMIRR